MLRVVVHLTTLLQVVGELQMALGLTCCCSKLVAVLRSESGQDLGRIHKP